MFLAWNEIQKNKLRFTLMIGVLMLVAYLVFFLSGLANGLASLNREAVDKWDASVIVLTEEPTASLDSDRAYEVMQLLKSETKNKKTTTIVVNHDSRLAEYCDKVYKMVDGVLKLQEQNG